MMKYDCDLNVIVLFNTCLLCLGIMSYGIVNLCLVEEAFVSIALY